MSIGPYVGTDQDYEKQYAGASQDYEILFIDQHTEATQLTVGDTRCRGRNFVIAVIILAIGCVLAAYFANPNAHHFFNNFFDQIRNGTMTVHQGLMAFGLPVLLSGALSGMALHIHRKHKEANYSCDFRKIDRLIDCYDPISLRERITKTCQALKPSWSQAIALLAIAALIGTSAALMCIQPALFKPAINHNVAIWKGAAICISAEVAVVALNIAVDTLQRKAIQKKQLVDQRAAMYRGFY